MPTYRLIKFWVVVFLLVTILTMICAYGQDSDKFFRAINYVEAGGRSGKISGYNDAGKALGPMQLHRDYWKDSGVQGSYSQCTNYAYSCRVMEGYFLRYCAYAYTHRDWETCARVHNGGPNGAKHSDTLAYWCKVRKHLTSY
jgi:hypothetical protein